MGEARRKKLSDELPAVRNGVPLVNQPAAKPVRVVRSIGIQNNDKDRVVMLMLGDEGPEIAVALDAEEARKTAMVLLQHADALPKIVIVGGEDPPPEGETP